MKKVMTIVGARPQFIKAAALNRVFKRDYDGVIQELIVHTGQHYDEGMSQVFFDEMEIDVPFAVLKAGSGNHGEQTGRMMMALEQVVLKEQPDAVIVYGDTNSTMAGALVASKCNIPIVHIEAGLRSFLRTMPEEINRVVTDHVSTLLFSPTQKGIDNLQQEGMVQHDGAYSAVNPGVFLCGDVMYDNALYYGSREVVHPDVVALEGKRFVLSTIHRDHNTDDPAVLKSIVETLLHLTQQHDLEWVLPVHPRLRKNLELQPDLMNKMRNASHVHLIQPVGYIAMLQLEQMSTLIVTDSGGVQKESYFAQRPCVILRSTTEWTEIVQQGRAILAGADPDKMTQAFETLLKAQFNDWPELYGDGKAAESIAAEINRLLHG
jgi:UDP-GlcNAc3NAcA epimerase